MKPFLSKFHKNEVAAPPASDQSLKTYSIRKDPGPVNTEGLVASSSSVIVSSLRPEDTSAVVRCREERSPYRVFSIDRPFPSS